MCVPSTLVEKEPDEEAADKKLNPDHYGPGELQPLQIVVDRAENLPEPFDGTHKRFDIPPSLFVEVSLLRESGGMKFLLAERLTSELNDQTSTGDARSDILARRTVSTSYDWE